MASWEPSENADEFKGCWKCKHLAPTDEAMACKAYGEGIPLRIFSGEVDHMQPRPGQKGDIIFEEK